VGFGFAVGEVNVRVGDALVVGDGFTFADSVTLGAGVGMVSGFDDTDSVEQPPSVIASPPTSPMAARTRSEGRSTAQVCRTKPTIRWILELRRRESSLANESDQLLAGWFGLIFHRGKQLRDERCRDCQRDDLGAAHDESQHASHDDRGDELWMR